jgi:hypothetical protein
VRLSPTTAIARAVELEVSNPIVDTTIDCGGAFVVTGTRMIDITLRLSRHVTTFSPALLAMKQNVNGAAAFSTPWTDVSIPNASEQLLRASVTASGDGYAEVSVASDVDADATAPQHTDWAVCGVLFTSNAHTGSVWQQKVQLTDTSGQYLPNAQPAAGYVRSV